MIRSTGILRIPPIRSAEQFFGKNGWAMPNFEPTEFDQLQNHLIQNLIYYQANYGAILFFLLTIISFFRPIGILVDLLVVALLLIGFVYSTEQNSNSDTILHDRPIVILIFLLITAFMIVRIFNTVPPFVIGIAIPIGFFVIHSTFRSAVRSTESSNQEQTEESYMTPMGLLLSCLAVKSYEHSVE